MRKGAWWAACAVTVLLAGWGVWHLKSAGGVAPGPPPLPAPVLTRGPEHTIAVPKAQLPRTLERSLPYKMVIKKISLWTMIDQIGLKRDGRIETPPYEKADRAAWYRNSSTPGEAGPAVILGHVDSKERIAAFFYVSRIRPGDTIEIVRDDRSTVVFEVDSVEQFAKANFPTNRVYGPTNEATLRLVTCGGKYDIRRQSYVDNIVVFATMTDFRPSPAPKRRQ